MSKFASYGVLEQHDTNDNIVLQSTEEIKNLGYSVIDSGYTSDRIKEIANCFDTVYSEYVKIYKKSYLEKIDEINGIRLPLVFNKMFLDLAFNPIILAVIKSLIPGKFYLNQQNGIINPAGKCYNQDAFHRDLPYQHFTSSRPLAINALYCVDKFTKLNGGTIVIPSSHKSEKFPSDTFIEHHALSIEASAGSFIILDCMLFHRGGFNDTQEQRRAVNHVYSIPLLKQQISIPNTLSSNYSLSSMQRDILGYTYKTSEGIDAYLQSRQKK